MIRGQIYLTKNARVCVDFRKVIIQALEDRYNAQISEAEATLKIYMEKPVGIGEHPQHIDECDKLIDKIANAEEKLRTLQAYKI
jgi:methylaspartate ammonia-lyase